jgi:hypothetical protein
VSSTRGVAPIARVLAVGASWSVPVALAGARSCTCVSDDEMRVAARGVLQARPVARSGGRAFELCTNGVALSRLTHGNVQLRWCARVLLRCAR